MGPVPINFVPVYSIGSNNIINRVLDFIFINLYIYSFVSNVDFFRVFCNLRKILPDIIPSKVYNYVIFYHLDC